MPVFASKDAFIHLGLEKLQPSPIHISQDCYICLNPLAVHSSHTTNTPISHNDTSSSSSASSNFHSAVRITRCDHVFGEACLTTWLNVGNTCPMCRSLLFEKEQPHDIALLESEMRRMLGREVADERYVANLRRFLAEEPISALPAWLRCRNPAPLLRRDDAERGNEIRDRDFGLEAEDFLEAEEMDFSDEGDEEGGEDEEEGVDASTTSTVHGTHVDEDSADGEMDYPEDVW